MLGSLATDIADPVERLAALHASTSASKEMTEAVGARNLTELSQLAPGTLIGLGTRLAGQFSRAGHGRCDQHRGPHSRLFVGGPSNRRHLPG